MILPVLFFTRPTLVVLEELMGMVLVRRSMEGATSGMIVEAEAYVGEDDPACFASRGRTKKSEMLYGPPGRAFVYLNYGIHHLLNVVTEEKDFPAAILIRAVEPLEGIPLMKKRRGSDDWQNLCSGPAKMCQAFGIDLSLNGVPVYSSRSPIFVKERYKEKADLVWRSRIGIKDGKDKMWRACIKDNPFISVGSVPRRT